MAKAYPGVILRVPEGSLADELGLVAGDKILAINDMPLRDIIDVSFAMADEDKSPRRIRAVPPPWRLPPRRRPRMAQSHAAK